MDSIVEFARVAPFATFVSVCAIYYTVKWVIWMPHALLARWSRHRCIMEHGWPLVPMDADGDIIYADDDKTKEKLE